MHMSPSRRVLNSRRRVLAGLAVLTLTTIAAACGDDDDDRAAAPPTSTTTPASPTTEVVSTDEHDGPVNPCDPSAPEDALALEGDRPAPDAVLVEVTAVDHEFLGIEPSYEPGQYGFRMTNEGDEVHEMAVLRIRDGETRTLDELLQLPESEAQQVTTYLGGAVACPGQTADPLGLELVPGRYVAMCFIPSGLTPDVPSTAEGFDGLGAPHFAQGMATEFRVDP